MLEGYYVNNVYLINPFTALLRFHHSDKPDIRIVLSTTNGIWITKYELPKTSSGIASKLRKEIHRAKIKKVFQPRGERIIILEFGESPYARKVILEFFGGGNIIVTDEEYNILSYLRHLKVRHRTIKLREKYVLPPERGLNVKNIEFGDIVDIKKTDLEVSRWLGRNLALSKKYIEEILTRSNIEIMLKGSELDDEQLPKLFSNLKDVVNMVLVGDVEPTVIYKNNIPIDAAPFMLKAYQDHKIKRFETFIEALDEVHTHQIKSSTHEESFDPINRKIDELTKTIEKQIQAGIENKKNSALLREYAENIQKIAFENKRGSDDIIDILKELGATKAIIMKGRLELTVHGISLSTIYYQSLMKIASLIFIEAKELERKIKVIENAQSKLTYDLEILKDKLVNKIIDVESKKPQEKKDKMWYERYRWFKTSEGLLAIGGRDATTNNIILSKYTEDKDLIFHADLHGSPFFILKGDESSIKSINEVAQAVVLFSRAWKDGFSSANAYWIHSDQVKKQAPSGMFLPRGSYLIQGSKNLVKDVKIECAVGIINHKNQWTVCSGPPEAIHNNSVGYVVITPEKGKISDTAKRIKLSLIDLLNEKAQYIKQIPIEDFIRVLPSGGGKIILKEIR